MKQCFFAVDLGATSGRTILGTFTSNGLEMEEVNRFPNHLIEVGRHFYWDIYELYRHIIEGLRIAARKGVEITSIGIDTWGVDFVCVGKDGGFLRQPYSYRDPCRCDGELQCQYGGDSVYRGFRHFDDCTLRGQDNRYGYGTGYGYKP